MHGLAPAPAVARAAQPASPERDGGVELGSDVRVGVRSRLLAAVEHERRRLSRTELDVGADVAAIDDLEWGVGRQADRERL
jgi:hypothetical protein